jgi:hypothetical protein
MFNHRGLQDVFFIALYWGVALLALLAAVYLLFRRRNVFMHEDAPEEEPRPYGHRVRSSLRLRRWTAALMMTMAASHVWWYAIGQWWLADDWLTRTIMVILLDHATLVPLVMAVLLRMLQDRRRPLWPWLVVQSPVVMFAVVGIVRCDWFYGYTLPHYWQLGTIAAFVVYYIFALRQYGRWLLDNYADLKHKEVWQSLAFAVVLFVIYAVYTSNMGEMAREYLSQVISIVIIAFLVWRVETLEELPSEEDMKAF